MSITTQKQEIRANFQLELLTISNTISTFRLKLGKILAALEVKIAALDIDSKAKREFKSSLWEDLKSVHDIGQNECQKALRLAQTKIRIQDLEAVKKLHYNGMHEIVTRMDSHMDNRLYFVHLCDLELIIVDIERKF